MDIRPSRQAMSRDEWQDLTFECLSITGAFSLLLFLLSYAMRTVNPDCLGIT